MLQCIGLEFMQIFSAVWSVLSYFFRIFAFTKIKLYMIKKLRYTLCILMLTTALATGWSQNTIVLGDQPYLDINTDTAQSGVIYDDGGSAGNYGNDKYYSVVLRALPGDTLRIWGWYELYDNVGWNYDYLELRGNTSTLLEGTGTVVSNYTDGYCQVIFYSDGDLNGPGFELHWEVRPSHCNNPVFDLNTYNIQGTTALLHWNRRYYSYDPGNQYKFAWNGHDTLLTQNEVELTRLQRNTTYTVSVAEISDETDSGCYSWLTFTTDSCNETVMGLRIIEKQPTSLRLAWASDEYSGPYLVDWGTGDTIVAEARCLITGLNVNTQYTLHVTSVLDTDCTQCTASLVASTSCFKARVSGLRPLIGNDAVTLTADSADAYLWSTGETTRSITVTEAGIYRLIVFTNGGCTDTLMVGVSNVELDIDLAIPTDICEGEQFTVHVGMASDATVRVNDKEEAVMSDPTRIFLPDGVDCDPTSDHGCSYRSNLEFNGFGNNELVTSPSDIKYVMLNLEHSYIGDLYVNITCPNGQNADILRFSGSGASDCTSNIDNTHRGWVDGENCSGCSFGGALDQQNAEFPCDSTADQNQAGEGRPYCWSNSFDDGYEYAPGDALVYRTINYMYDTAYHVSTMTPSDVATKTQFYMPDESFDHLLGCPMNGNWYIEVIDGWGMDNGYIFGWELALNPDRLMRNGYRPSVRGANLQGAFASRVNDTVFTLHAPNSLTHDTIVNYTVTIIDTLGNEFDTTFSVAFHPRRERWATHTVVENDLPFVFYGQAYTSEVWNQPITVSNTDGCDSTIYLTLQIAYNTAATFDTTICSGSLPIVWRGNTFSHAESRIVTSTNMAGADSVETFNLNVIPGPGAHIHGQETLIGEHDQVVLTADTAAAYLWNTGATTQSIVVTQPGTYTLTVNPGGQCESSDQVTINQLNPTIDINIPSTLCAGDTLNVGAGVSMQANLRVNPVQTELSDGQRIFLPDGTNCDPSSDHGCSYRSGLTFDGFSSSQTITNVNDIQYVMLNIEHSYIGDLYINITCPNGQNADILRFYGGGASSPCTGSIGAEHTGWQYGNNNNNTFLGLANSDRDASAPCDSSRQSNRPGIGWRYCWSNNTQEGYTYAGDGGLIYRAYNHNYINPATLRRSADSSNVASGINFYHPDESFDSLIGCPINGTWYIEVIDGWSADNGYIFGWGLSLASELVNAAGYSPNIDSAGITGLYASRISDTTFRLTAPNDLDHDTTVTYWVTIYDSTGTWFDTSFTVTYLAHPSRTIFETVVENDIPVTRYGHTYTSDVANEVFVVPSNDGCDSVITYNLHVIPNTYASIFDTICQNNLPYTWLGELFTTGGSKQHIIDNAQGADSIVTMTLTVLANTYATYNDTCVENDLPRNYLGLTATGSISGQQTIIANAAGCDSVVTYNLKVWYNMATTQNQSLCDDALTTFQWNGLSTTIQPLADNLGAKYIQHDTLIYNTTTTHGADSVVTLYLNVRPTYHLDINDVSCANQSYQFEGTSYTTSGSYPHTLHTAGTPMCDSVRTLHLTVYDTSRTDTTAVACDQFAWHGRDYTVSTNDLLMGQYLNQAGCDSTLALHLTVNYSQTAVFNDTCVENDLPRSYLGIAAYGDTTGAMATISTTQGCDSVVSYSLHVWRNHAAILDTLICNDMLAEFEWNGQRPTLTVLDGTMTGITNPVQYDTMFATIPTTMGADSMITMRVEVYPNYHFEYYDTICDDLSYVFEGVSYNVTGDYEVTHITASGHCDSVLSLHLVVNPTFGSERYDTIFVGDSVMFEGQAYFTEGVYPIHYTTDKGCDSTYTLYLVTKPLHERELMDSICEGTEYDFYGRLLTTTGVYVDTVSALIHTDGDTIVTLTLTVKPKPTVSITLTDSNCSPMYYTLTGTTTGYFTQWNSTPYDEVLDENGNDLEIRVNPRVPTKYYLYADYTETGFCQSVDSLTVQPIDPVHAIIDVKPEMTTLEERDVMAFNRSTGAINSHRWGVLYDGVIHHIDTATTLSITVPNYVDTTCIWLKVTSRTCADTDTVCVPMLRSNLFVPNVFTPTLDINNTFKVIGMGIPEFEMWIYDRRGDLVFHSTDINEGWDGKHNGTLCAQGSYVYKIKYTDLITPGGYQSTTGTVTLIK